MLGLLTNDLPVKGLMFSSVDEISCLTNISSCMRCACEKESIKCQKDNVLSSVGEISSWTNNCTYMQWACEKEKVLKYQKDEVLSLFGILVMSV